MIRVIKFVVFSFSWYFMFKNVNRSNYRGFLDNFNTHLRSLSILNLFEVLKNLLIDSMSENLLLRGISIPLNLDWKMLNDTRPKKLFLIGLVFTIIVNRWLQFFKRIFLWPFKLGIFSFIYSVLGIDVSWFLNLWNVFSINIPQWICSQYLNLYNNWLTWWYSTVNIKSITSVPLIENKKKVSSNVTKIPVEIQSEIDNKVWYLAGLVTFVVGVGFILWYFDIFSPSNPGPDNRPGPSGSSGFPVGHLTDSNLNNNFYPSNGNDRELIQIRSNETRPNIYDPLDEINNAWKLKEVGSSSSNIDASTSTAATSNPWGNNPPSPTGSNDSSETITNFKFKRGFLNRKPNS